MGLLDRVSPNFLQFRGNTIHYADAFLNVLRAKRRTNVLLAGRFSRAVFLFTHVRLIVMTNAAIQKRLAKLETEVKTLRALVVPRLDLSIDEKNWRTMRPTVRKVRAQIYKERYGKQPAQKQKSKPLPKWLQASLKDVEEGRTFGPFDTVEELRASLESKGA